MSKFKRTRGPRPIATSQKKIIRGFLRSWREIHGTETSHFAGQLYQDRSDVPVSDGTSITTGTALHKLDRGSYFLIKTGGPYAYILLKKDEFKP